MDRRANKDKIRPLPSQEELNRVLSYNAGSGILTWRERPRVDFQSDRSHKVWNARYAGTPALHGVGKKGYRVGHLFGQMAKASRVIWKMVTGFDPELIDHVNGDKSDNRLVNLNNVSDQGNAKNRREYANNSSGVTGVYWNKAVEKWHAQIRSGGKKVHLGFFDSLEDAREARSVAELEMGFHSNHGRKTA